MKFFSLTTLLLASNSLLGGVFAGRMSDISRRKGFTEGMIRDRQKRDIVEERAPKNRFLTNATEKYFVKSLPEIPQSFMTEMYSGLVPIDKNNASRALYFVFTPTVGKPVDTLTIWLNGGPGCSSLEGFFQENGRIIWSWGMFAPEINPYAWSNLTNVLWVEQPVGTGFSIGDVTATSQEDIAADFVKFFANFQEIFGIKNFEIYVTGESYAGRYVPYIANAMLDEKNTTNFNLSGIITYDPCIGSYVYMNQLPTVPFVLQNNNQLGFNSSFLSMLEKKDKSCGYSAYRDQYYSFPPNGTQPPKYFNYTSEADCDLWDTVYYAAYEPNPCFNVYEIGLQCPLLGDPLGYPTDLQYTYAGTPVYFNRTDVKKAMHAPMDVPWDECKGPVFVGNDPGPEDENDSSADPIQKVLPRVIEATNRVLVANGDLDLEILTNGTLLSIQNMTWNGKLGFQTKPSKPIIIGLSDLMYDATFEASDNSGLAGLDNPQGTMGIQHFERGLMWAETYLSGHMEPQFQPRSSYRHLQWLLGHIETL